MTKMRTRLIPLLLALLLAVPAALAGSGAQQVDDAGKRFNNQTKTFTNSRQITLRNNNSQVAPADPYPATLTVNGFQRGRVQDVNVTLRNFSHARPDDVEVLLVKGNVNLILMSDVGGSTSVNGITLTFDDQAGASLPAGGPLVTGTFFPTNSREVAAFPSPAPSPGGADQLSTFNGIDPNGDWQLFVLDDFGFSDEGSISGGFELEITAKVEQKGKDKKNKNNRNNRNL